VLEIGDRNPGNKSCPADPNSWQAFPEHDDKLPCNVALSEVAASSLSRQRVQIPSTEKKRLALFTEDKVADQTWLA